MKLGIKKATWSSLTEKDVKQLRRLHYPIGSSVMGPQLQEQRPSVRVWLCRDVSKPNSPIIAWCTAEHVTDFVWCVERYIDIDVFVKRAYRRRGVANRLLNRALRDVKPLKRRIELPYMFKAKVRRGRK